MRNLSDFVIENILKKYVGPGGDVVMGRQRGRFFCPQKRKQKTTAVKRLLSFLFWAET